ncbi:hypothetical protein D782_0526 [Enterobacteriaceae bacterium strain FGI 57]|nr:hypothetical protein D782_0526 [Enterobacteriaceae bacterium strain FGI 57]
MQSVKKTITIAAFLFSAGVSAEPTTALPFTALDAAKGAQTSPAQTSPAQTPPAQTPPVSSDSGEIVSDGKTTQEFLKEVVENDFAYQLKSRQLEQEVELEKMRSEIRKLRGEDKIPVAAAPQPQQAAPQTDAPKVPESKIPENLPFVLLESEIAGTARVAVTNNDRSKLMYVRPGDRFEMGGVHYQLVRDKKNGLLVKDVAE